MFGKSSYRILAVLVLLLVLHLFSTGSLYAQNGIQMASKQMNSGEMNSQSLPNSSFLTFHTQLMHYYNSGNFFNAKQLSYGLKVGTMKNTGWFLGLMTNFNFQGPFNICKESQIEPNTESISYFEGLFGLTGRYYRPLSFHFGLGYFYRSYNYKMLNGKWGHFPEDVSHGPVATAGFMFHIKGFVLIAECVTNYNILCYDVTRAFGVGAKLGLGFCLPNGKEKKKRAENQLNVIMRPFVPMTSMPDGFDKSQFVSPDVFFSQTESDNSEPEIDTPTTHVAQEQTQQARQQPSADSVVTIVEDTVALSSDYLIQPEVVDEHRRLAILMTEDSVEVAPQEDAYSVELTNRTIDDLIKRTVPCGELKVKDIDNNTYGTVAIGQQCWLKENLRTTRYPDGTVIPISFSSDTLYGCRYFPGGDSANVAKFGYLYNWLAVVKQTFPEVGQVSVIQGICPDGWHVPDDTEWTQFEAFVSSQSKWICDENKLFVAKAIAATHEWNESDQHCAIGNYVYDNNISGFSALPAGAFYGQFGLVGKGIWFWTSTRGVGNSAIDRFMLWDEPIIRRNDKDSIAGGFSVRCIKN